MSFENTYADNVRAAAYAELDFPGTYHLAFRDLPILLGSTFWGARALDFGCGAGRSTRFLKKLGFSTEGIDISEAMLAQARQRDPEGSYFHVPEGDLSLLPDRRYDRILSAFTFDNVRTESKPSLFQELARLLKPGGRLLNLVSSEALYGREWASFSTRDFPGNRNPRSGDLVYTVMKDIADARPIPDIYCPEEEYLRHYAEAGLKRVQAHHPLGLSSEPFHWINEGEISPWRIDVLERPLRLSAPALGRVWGAFHGPC